MKRRLTKHSCLAALDQTSAIFSVPPREIVGGRCLKLETITQARQALCAALYRNTATTVKELGVLLGGRDHTTIIYHVRKAEERAAADPDYAAAIAQIAGVLA